MIGLWGWVAASVLQVQWSTSPLTLFSLSSANPVSSAGSIHRPCSAKSPTPFSLLGMVI